MDEIRRAVDRIDDPAVLLVAALHAARFLHQETVARARFLELLADDFLTALVGGGDEVAGSLDRDLQIGDFAEIALYAARRLAHGIDHDGEISRLSHDEFLIETGNGPRPSKSAGPRIDHFLVVRGDLMAKTE
jgi:hypothetical protein